MGVADGAMLGALEVEGESVGRAVGSDVSVGLALGLPVGALDVEGESVGCSVGECVGDEVVGEDVG